MSNISTKYSSLSKESQEYFRQLVEMGDGKKLIKLLTELSAIDENQRDEQAESSEENKILRVRINTLIKKLGITPKYKGYFYIRTAVEYMYDKDLTGVSITKDVYPYVKSVHGTDTQSGVERAIRHAIGLAWKNNANAELLKELTKSYSIKGVPTNATFLCIIVEYLRNSF